MWPTENPWPAAIALSVLALVVLMIGLRRSQAKWLLAGVLIGLLVPVAFVIDRMVITPAEEIEAILFELRDAVVANDADTVLSHLSPQADREGATIRTGMAIGRLEPDLSLTDLETRVTANSTAVSHFRANGTFVVKSTLISGERHIATRWNVSWRREAGVWKIYEVVRLHPITGEQIGILNAE